MEVAWREALRRRQALLRGVLHVHAALGEDDCYLLDFKVVLMLPNDDLLFKLRLGAGDFC